MTSPALTTTESLAVDSARSGLLEVQPEDTSEFGEENSDPNDDQAPKPQPQKRRRVTRACDECRRKKIKCDGKQPCTHCTVYSYGEFLAEPEYVCMYANRVAQNGKRPIRLH